ncbi:hypothetical protein HDF15_003378 [Granulicella mallensis]|uniref:Uncharacterized protein n=1 Tax=Granulicella mallensis TaxID=940614 RepID=A0A7W8EBW3_9BACT|nr:hypothetical protein [Granulicella mallensis]
MPMLPRAQLFDSLKYTVPFSLSQTLIAECFLENPDLAVQVAFFLPDNLSELLSEDNF